MRQARRTHEGHRDRGLALGAHASSGKPSGRQLLKLAEPKSDAPNGTKSLWKSCLYLSRHQIRYLSGINFLKTEQKDPAEEKVLLVKCSVSDSTGPLWPQPWWAMDRGGVTFGEKTCKLRGQAPDQPRRAKGGVPPPLGAASSSRPVAQRSPGIFHINCLISSAFPPVIPVSKGTCCFRV